MLHFHIDDDFRKAGGVDSDFHWLVVYYFC